MDSTNTLPQIQTAQSQKEVTANGLFAAASPATLFARHAEASLGLVWGYLGGRWGGTLIPNATLTLPTTSTVDLVVELATGSVSIDSSSPSLWNDPDYGRLYRIVTSATGVLSWEDHRAGPHGVFGAGSGTGGSGGAGVTDGDYGDVVVSSGGTSWAVPDEAITYAKIQDVSATARVLGRRTAGDGPLEECTLSQVLDFIGSAAQGDILYRGASTWARLGAGTDGQFLKTQGPGANPVWDNSGAGLSYFAEARFDTGVNASTPVHALGSIGSETNIDAALVPKGAGAIVADIPDGTSTGGNKRGANAVDLQMVRTNAARVASGTRAGILSGSENTASGQDAAVAGGVTNTASGTAAAVLGGQTNTASGANASVLGGDTNSTSGDNGVAHGHRANDRGIYNSRVHGGGDAFGAGGMAQRQEMVLMRTLSASTAAVLTVNDTSPGSNNQLRLADGSTYLVRGMVTMRRNSDGESKVWSFEAGIKRASGAGTTSMIAACTPVVVAADAGASAWALTVDANTSLGCLRLTAQGDGGGGVFYSACAVLDSVQVLS